MRGRAEAAESTCAESGLPTVEDDGTSLGELLGRALEELGLSSEDFGKEVGVGNRVVQAWLRGASAPTARARTALLEFLRAKSDALPPRSASARAAQRLTARARSEG